MAISAHDPADERTHRKALETLDILDRWNERSKGHFTQPRWLGPFEERHGVRSLQLPGL